MDKKYTQFLLEKTKKDYNKIADQFSSTRNYIWEDLKPLVQYITPGDKVLDLGCGNGRFLQLFQDKNIDYTGIDNCKKLIEAARKKYPDEKFQVANVLNPPFPNDYFDKIYCVAVFHHIPSGELRLKFLQETKRVLKKDGLLILTVWNLWQKRTGWSLPLKFTFLKIIGKSKLDFGDVFFPWKNSKGEVVVERYIHYFTKRALKKLAKKARFKIAEIGVLKRPERKDTNIYLILQKP